MSESSHIRYLQQSQIDKIKWDNCISSAENGLIYGYSFYLDCMSKHWDALVLNDYEAVMPLTWNMKYSIRYLYQPFLTAQLGVFGKSVSRELVNDFIAAIPSSFRYIDIYLNYSNEAKNTKTRNNYILDLNKSYESLYGNYRENIQRNIKKATQHGCSIKKDVEIENVIDLAILQMRSQNEESKENIERFRKLYQLLKTKNMATAFGVFSTENKLLASAVFFFSHYRAYYILVGNHPEGKTTGASHALIDGFIKDHAEKNILLDFEGSDIPNLAFFYSSFGATLETYPVLKINRLPFYLRWIKK